MEQDEHISQHEEGTNVRDHSHLHILPSVKVKNNQIWVHHVKDTLNAYVQKVMRNRDLYLVESHIGVQGGVVKS